MSWQQDKDHGQRIYLMSEWLDGYRLRPDRRVIHINGSPSISTARCVRYDYRWFPLHEARELKTRYKGVDGKYRRVYLDYAPLRASDEKLPFVRTWDEPGSFYEVFGY